MGRPLRPTSADVVYHVLNRAGRCSTMTATTPRLNECCGKQWFLTPFPVLRNIIHMFLVTQECT